MGREHVIQSWVKHEDDDWRNIPENLLDNASGYSGEQVGNRQAVNNGNVHVRASRPGYLANGKADIAGAADPADDIKGNPLLSVDPAYRVLLEYPAKVAALDAALKSGAIVKSIYDQALHILDVKHEKAQDKIHTLSSVRLEDDPEPEEIEVVAEPVPEDVIAEYFPSKGEKEIADYIYKNNLV